MFRYDPNTGIFYRRDTGRIVGCPDAKGYLVIGDGRKGRYKAHRLAWLYMTGSWPSGTIDHINGHPADNRWVNLREATLRENNLNTKKRQSLSGFRGVEFMGKRYRARIRVESGIPGKRKYLELGKYNTAEEAYEAYKRASIEYYGNFGNRE